MKNNQQHPRMHILTSLVLILTLLLGAPGLISVAAAGESPAVQEMNTVDQPTMDTNGFANLTPDDQTTIRELIREAQYQFAWQVSDGEWAYRAPNRANDLVVSLAADGLQVAHINVTGEPSWDFGLSLVAYGEQTFPATIGEAGLKGSRERVEYHWSQEVVEWYANNADGVEHGLNLAAPPAGVDGSTVELTFALRGSLTPEMAGDGGTLRLKDNRGKTVLLYDQLAVYDAMGRSLPAHLRLIGGQASTNLQMVIDGAGAIYPLTVDPILHSQETKITPDYPDAGDQFGYSVSISGDTAIVGAWMEDGSGTDRGAAYIFERNEDGTDSWGQVRKLLIANPEDGAQFGASVAISGDTAVVGAPMKDNVGGTGCVTGLDCGAAYIFTRNRGGPNIWAMVTVINAGGAQPNDQFGSSVAISGDTVVVGAKLDDGLVTDRGSAYIFERNYGGAENWGQSSSLQVFGAAASDYFGHSVAISGDTIVVGAPGVDGNNDNSGAAYIFERNAGSTWGYVAKLTALDARGYDSFGSSVAISGDTVVVGAYEADIKIGNEGAAYIFVRNYDPDNPGTPLAENWGQMKKLIASDPQGFDYFGNSVSISGDTVVVGAYREDGTGDNDLGAVYAYKRNQGGADNWGQASKLTASDADEKDYFGNSVSISGDTIIVGANWNDDAGGSDCGTAYLFVSGEGQWKEVAIPRASDAADNDHYGMSVAVSGDTAIVGADWDKDSGGDNRGAAYIITRNETGADKWGEVKKLFIPTGVGDDYFGRSVSISDDIAVVGAWGEDGAGTDRGAAYVFMRNYDPNNPNDPLADNWGLVKKLTPTTPNDNDYFGFSVGISDDTIVVGVYGYDGSGTDRGIVYIFLRNEGGKDNWGLFKGLVASDKQSNDYFGHSVAISGDTIVVGAYGEDGNGGDDRGAAYVFERNYDPNNPTIPWADRWGQVKKLSASDPANNDFFGYSVAVSEDTVVVGAYLEDSDGAGFIDRGAAYVFERNYNPGNPSAPSRENWGEVKKLTASDAASNDFFGFSVAISGDTVVVGAYGVGGSWIIFPSGAAYIFERNHNPGLLATPIADNWGEVTKLRASDAAPHDYFGRSVAISGDTVVVGAYKEDGESGTDRGSAYVFKLKQLREITVSPGSLDFGDQDVAGGPTPSQTVTITNDGVGDLQISSVGLTGTGAGEFVIVSDSGETTLTPGATRTVQVAFDPTSEGWKSANLSIASDDDDEPTVYVLLSGNGVPYPDISVSPSSLDFGRMVVDNYVASAKTVTISNDGVADLNLSSISVTGADAAEFPTNITTGEITLPPGGTHTVQVWFQPTSEGAKSANLTITSDDPDEPTVNVALSGTGVESFYLYLPLVLDSD